MALVYVNPCSIGMRKKRQTRKGGRSKETRKGEKKKEKQLLIFLSIFLVFFCISW
jgi:hypothetical protein